MLSWESLVELPRVLARETFGVKEGEIAFLIVLDQADHPYGLSDPSSWRRR
jgi:hypothetical protein